MTHVFPYTAQPTNTTVVVNQPTVMQGVGKRDWSSGLLGCFSDPVLCVCVFCFQPYHACLLADKAGESFCLPICLPNLWLLPLRTKVREQNNIEGSILGDYCAVTFCNLCVQCQIDRELTYTRNNPPEPPRQVLQHLY